MENFTKEMNEAGKKDKLKEKDVTFLMSKEDGNWVISNSSSATKEIFSDMTNAINEVNNNLESYMY